MEWFFWRAYFPIISQTDINMSNVKAVIEQLGILYQNDYPSSKEGHKKIAIRKIHDTLNKKVSKRQIKKFINLYVTKNNRISIPYKSMIIFETLVRLTDDNDELRNYCKCQCENCVNRKNSIYCREKLMPSFYDFVIIHSNQFNERAMAEIVEPLLNFNVICK